MKNTNPAKIEKKCRNIGIIGCGHISNQYLANLSQINDVEVIACSDIDIKKAKNQSLKYGIPKTLSTKELLSDNTIDIILNLTIPNSHYEVSIAALKSGKHVYSEKPLAINKKDGNKIIRNASELGLQVGCAPDTFLGGGIQTCRKIIADGLIGKPIAATAFMTNHGHENWHPSPEFYYQKGGGPMFDMGPYYLTALIYLLGRAVRVAGATQKTFSSRTITSQPDRIRQIKVEVPTHVTSVINFEENAIATIITSFDIWDANLPKIEIYGTKGTLSVPDPNKFDGEVFLKTEKSESWESIPLVHNSTGRGIGLSEMINAINNGQTPLANGEMAFHVLDVMESIHESSETGKHVNITSPYSQSPIYSPIK